MLPCKWPVITASSATSASGSSKRASARMRNERPSERTDRPSTGSRKLNRVNKRRRFAFSTW